MASIAIATTSSRDAVCIDSTTKFAVGVSDKVQGLARVVAMVNLK
jgi:hypothetical protein